MAKDVKKDEVTIVTPKQLDDMFKLGDGGKTIRRHLRKKFNTNHEHNDSWKWNSNDPVLAEIIAYFKALYAPKKEEAV